MILGGKVDVMNRELGVDYEGKRIIVISSKKVAYQVVIGKEGEIVRDSSSSSIGVKVDGYYNKSSSNGTYWFKQSEVELKENGGLMMEGFNRVAIVNLLDDCYKKDYGFALYESEWKILQGPGELVVVNARGKDNRVLAVMKNVLSVEEYGKGVTAQVVGVVNTEGFNERKKEIQAKVELDKKRKEIEEKLRSKIEKLKDAEFYERMAKEYADKDPELSELVSQLKELGN